MTPSPLHSPSVDAAPADAPSVEAAPVDAALRTPPGSESSISP